MHNESSLENIMKYLPDALKEAFDYDISKCPDYKEIKLPLVNVSDVLKAHYILADYFTDPTAEAEVESMLVGVRSYDLLTSAICRQTCGYNGHRKYTDNIEICSTLFYGLVKNHAFHDGNKRTALLTLLAQLQSYNYYPTAGINDFEKLVLAVADDSVSVKYKNAWKKFEKKDDTVIHTIAYVLRRMVENKNTSFRCDISMKEFIRALEKQGVVCERNGLKTKFTRKSKKGIFSKTYTYFINYYGETRVVTAGMARDTFDALHLFEEFPTYQSLFEGREPLYALISQFEQPLRRLKDE